MLRSAFLFSQNRPKIFIKFHNKIFAEAIRVQMLNKTPWGIFYLLGIFLFSSCSGTSGGGSFNPDASGYPVTPFTITDDSQLIGGPVAQGRVGDVLLENDRIKVIIQKPRKNSGVNSFGEFNRCRYS